MRKKTTLPGSVFNAPSTATATPAGEWVLEELGSGIFEDVSTGQPVAKVPIEKRIHVLLFAEAYGADALAGFHAELGSLAGVRDLNDRSAGFQTHQGRTRVRIEHA